MVIHQGLFVVSLFILAFAFDSQQLVSVTGETEQQAPVMSGQDAGELNLTSIEGNCSYVVTVETSCIKGAGTADRISLRFGDSRTTNILVRRLNTRHVKKVDSLDPNVLDDVPSRPFQACSVDQFQVDGPCVDTAVCYLYLKLIGSDNWRPGFVQIQVRGKPHLNSEYFYFRRYLPRHIWHGYELCDKEITSFGIKHKRKTFD